MPDVVALRVWRRAGMTVARVLEARAEYEDDWIREKPMESIRRGC